jgi:hypothetical protein
MHPSTGDVHLSTCSVCCLLVVAPVYRVWEVEADPLVLDPVLPLLLGGRHPGADRTILLNYSPTYVAALYS